MSLIRLVRSVSVQSVTLVLFEVTLYFFLTIKSNDKEILTPLLFLSVIQMRRSAVGRKKMRKEKRKWRKR